MTTNLRPEEVLDLDVLRRLTVIRGRLRNETPLRVGIGREGRLGSTSDITVIRTKSLWGEEVPYIPGSSLKGVFRSFVEQLARSGGLQVHDPWDFEAMEREEREGFCVVCALFGSTKVASHVRIYDAFPPEGRAPRVSYKTGVSIDRDFLGVRPGLLYTEEFVEPGNEWEFRMDVINVPFPDGEDPRTRYLRELLNSLKTMGLQVGARKSVGMGLVKLVRGTYEVYAVEGGAVRKVSEGTI